jgi:hypothetical protein
MTESIAGIPITALIALISGGLALVGALGSQIINTRSAQKTKKLEIFLSRKTDAYQKLLTVAGTFALDPKNGPKYLEFLAALEVATLFAAPQVQEALSGRDGLSVNAQRLRGAQTDEELQRWQVTTWYESCQRASQAMREDLRSLSDE